MSIIKVPGTSDEVQRAPDLRALSHGHSTEFEGRTTLEAAGEPEPRIRLGDALAAFAQSIGLTNEDIDAMEQARGKTLAKAFSFE